MTADILRIANKLALEEKSEFTLEELKQLVIDANAAYRIGNPSITDAEYDKLARYVGIEDGTKEVMDKVDGFEEVQLAVTMASMNKILNGEDFDYWIRTKKINPDSYLIATPKLDGLSLLANECKMPKLYTRGDGVYGRDISRYMKYFSQQIPPSVTKEFYTFGEIIMSRENFAKAKKIFKKKDGSDYENPRNMVSGKLVELEPSEAISYMSYIRYGMEENEKNKFFTKEKMLVELNQINVATIPYHVFKVSEFSEQLMQDLYSDWNTEYEIDGIILELNDLNLHDELGRETSTNNPCWARAYKGDFGEKGITEVTYVERRPTKDGVLKPLLHIKPIRLDGAEISKVFADNERFLFDYGIGEGTTLEIKRSGKVIPRISKVEGIEVLSAKELNKLREKMVFEDVYMHINVPIRTWRMASEYIGKIRWNDSRIEVYLTDAENNDDVKLQRLIFFFETIGVENLSDKTYEEFFKNGIDTVRKILQLSPKDLENWDGFGKRKAEIIVNSIKKAWNEASFVQIMHGSCCFPTLGGDKLTLITESNVYKKSAPGTITTDVLVSIKGIGEEAAKIFVNNFNKFSIFFSEIESLYTEKKKQEEKPTAKTGNKCQNWNVVFTGFRDKTIENYIVEEGGSIANGVSSKTTHLIMKEKGSGSVKEKKAMELNMQILNEKDIRNFFHYKDIKTEDKRSII